MSKYNKTINVTILEQVKSAAIIALIVSIGAFYAGIQFQKSSAVTVKNTVMVNSIDTTKK